MFIHQIQAVLDAAVDAVVIIDHCGGILLANRATGQMFRWDVAELRGRDISMLIPEPHRSGHPGDGASFLGADLDSAIGGGRDVLARRRDGSTFPVHLSVGRVAGLDPPQFVGFLHDLSDRVREAEEALRLNQRMMQVTRMAMMGEMAAGFAHEVNQPLTAIANYAHAAGRFLAAPQPDLAETREALREIAAEAQRAGEIIRRLRRIVRSSDDEDPAITPLPELIEELRTLCLADARANDTRIRLEIQPGLPPLVIRRLQITQVLLNLVRNALDSLAGDPPDAREIAVIGRCTPAGDCEIAVCDNGPGVAPQILDRMFEPFRSTKPDGTGLGLPMSQTIAIAHGGSLRHEPVAPRGACFILTVPAAGAAG